MTLLFDFGTTLNSSFFYKVGLGMLLTAAFLGAVYWRNRMKAHRILREQKLREEEQNRIRKRTAEDFHDEIGNRLTRIKLLASVAEQKLLINPEEIPKLLSQIKENAADLYSGAKDIIWALQPESDFLEAIILRIRQNTVAIFEYSEVKFSFSQSGNIPKETKLSTDCGRNLIMIFKEANHNILKHAKAKEVSMSVVLEEKKLKIVLRDNGSGLQERHLADTMQNGIQNMKHRAERIGAILKIYSEKGQSGTCIKLLLQLN